MDETRDAVKIIIDAYLTASQSQDPRVEEIAERAKEDEQRQWLVAEPLMFLVQAMRDRVALLEINSTLSAKLSAMQAERDRMKEALERIVGAKHRGRIGMVEPIATFVTRLKEIARAALTATNDGG